MELSGYESSFRRLSLRPKTRCKAMLQNAMLLNLPSLFVLARPHPGAPSITSHSNSPTQPSASAKR